MTVISFLHIGWGLNPRALGKAPGALCNPRWPAPQRRASPASRTKKEMAVYDGHFLFGIYGT